MSKGVNYGKGMMAVRTPFVTLVSILSFPGGITIIVLKNVVLAIVG